MSDPFLDDVFLLSKFDGSNGDTTYTPEIGTGDFSFPTNSQISTTEKKFGAAAASSTGGIVTQGSAGDFNFLHLGAEDWSFEFFLYFDGSFDDASPLFFSTVDDGVTPGIQIVAADAFPSGKLCELRVWKTSSGVSNYIWVGDFVVGWNYFKIAYDVSETTFYTSANGAASDEAFYFVSGISGDDSTALKMFGTY